MVGTIMNATFDLTNITNSTNVASFIRSANNFTDGSLVSFFVFAITVISIMKLSRGNVQFSDTVLVSSWSLFLFSLFLWYVDLLNFNFVIVYAIMTALISLYSWIIDN